MRWWGKAVGAVLGWMLLRHPLGLLVGGFLGHALDVYLDKYEARHPTIDDPYRTLGIAADSSDEDVDLAYRRMMAQYHPDKVAGAADEIRQLASRRATEINLAYEAIRKRRRR